MIESAAEHLAIFLKKERGGEVVRDRQVLEEIFRNFCLFGTSSVRMQVGEWLANQLDDWVEFPIYILQKYFSTPKTPVGPLDLFPQQEVYNLIQVVFLFFSSLFSFPPQKELPFSVF
jgi:hypothetical protein